MDKETFIRGYLQRSGLEEFRTPDGYQVPDCEPVKAVPCACGDESCKGWAMVRESGVEFHTLLYAPKRATQGGTDG